jgi:hypothetical protein
VSDSAAVDRAVFTALNDPTLLALLPDGVYFGVAPQSKTKVAIVMLPSHVDTDQFQGTAFETSTYMVKAMVKENSVTRANDAAARIQTLMLALPAPTGYTVAVVRRSERIAYTEADPDNPDILWQHRGGLYDVMVAPL